MKRLTTALLLLAGALCLGAAERLRITDATGSEGSAILRLAAELGHRHNYEVSIFSLEASAALEKLDAGETDLVLVNGADLPAERRKNSRRYATAAYLAVVNTKNPLRDVKADDLKLLFGIPSPKWEIVGGSAAGVHRMAVRARNERFAGEKLLRLSMPQGGIFLLDAMEEALTLAEHDPQVLLWGPFAAELPLRVAAVSVNGVAPTRENIRGGRYLFSIPRFAVFPERPSAPTREFLRLLGSGGFARMLDDDGELAELPAIPK